MRADARKNTELLRKAAVECFNQLGIGAPVKEIARRAGVSPGTLYNLYGGREGLVDAVLADEANAQLDEVLAHANLQTTPWDALVAFIEGMCDIKAKNPAIDDILMLRCPSAVKVAEVFKRAQSAGEHYIEQAHLANQLRSDFVYQDLFFIFSANTVLARLTESLSPGYWRRGVAFYLQGLQCPKQNIGAEPLTLEQLDTAIQRFALNSIKPS